jgi:hypothetical protein
MQRERVGVSLGRRRSQAIAQPVYSLGQPPHVVRKVHERGALCGLLKLDGGHNFSRLLLRCDVLAVSDVLAAPIPVVCHLISAHWSCDLAHAAQWRCVDAFTS